MKPASICPPRTPDGGTTASLAGSVVVPAVSPHEPARIFRELACLVGALLCTEAMVAVVAFVVIVGAFMGASR